MIQKGAGWLRAVWLGGLWALQHLHRCGTTVRSKHAAAMRATRCHICLRLLLSRTDMLGLHTN